MGLIKRDTKGNWMLKGVPWKQLREGSGMKARFQNRCFDNFVQDTQGRRQAYTQAKKYADNSKRMTQENGDSRNAEKTLDRLKETCVGIDMTWESWRAK